MDELLATLLTHVDDKYDKNEGYLVHDLLKAVAMILATLGIKIEDVEKLIDVDNLTGDLLAKFVSQRKGIMRTQATYAVGEVLVTGNGTINIGDIFETANGVQFEATEQKAIVGTGTVNIRCLKIGNIGNIPAHQITQMPVTLSGITSVTNPQPTHSGYEAESDDSLRERYYIAIRTPAASGNVYHYKQWSLEIAGVGDSKVYPVARGNNTVEVVIIDQQKQPANLALVGQVQQHIDPASEGLGYGQAPIGAKCYVVPASAVPIAISVSITKSLTYELLAVVDNIKGSIANYLKTIAFRINFVSYAKVGEAIIDAEGVEDYANLTINGGTSNITVPDKHVAVLGGVTIV